MTTQGNFETPKNLYTTFEISEKLYMVETYQDDIYEAPQKSVKCAKFVKTTQIKGTSKIVETAGMRNANDSVA